MGMIVSADDPMFDFVSMKAKFAGRSFAFKELKYDSDMDGATVVYANGSCRPKGFTIGRLKVTASGIMYLDDANELIHFLGPGFKRKVFPIVSQYSVPGANIITDTLSSVRITKVEGGGSDGGDPLTRSFTFQPLGILWDGIDPVGDALTIL